MNQTVPPEVLNYLQALEPGFFPKELFYEVTRLTVAPILELVPLRKINGNTEVLFVPRSSDDPHWPNKLNTPGTYIRPTDTEITLDSAFERLRIDELGGIVFKQAPRFAQTQFHKVNRGMELALVYMVDLSDVTEFPTGEWFSIEALPGNSVVTQHEIILNSARKL